LPYTQVTRALLAVSLMPRVDPRTHPAMREKMWKKGQSGNPRGRPPKLKFEEIVAKVLDEGEPGSDLSKREALARIFVSRLLEADRTLIKEFLAREWPATTKHEVTGRDGEALGRPQVPDLSSLSGEEREQLRELGRKAIGEPKQIESSE